MPDFHRDVTKLTHSPKNLKMEFRKQYAACVINRKNKFAVV